MNATPPLNLRQLHHVVLLADESHFGRAAARAFLSQPAFSRSVATLEQAIGMRLFDRGPGFVRPTTAGTQVIARARRLLSSSADLSRELALLRSGDLGDLTVGAGPFSGPTLMASAIAGLQADHPSVRVRLEIASPMVLQQMLRDEKLDFFIADLTEFSEQTPSSVEPLGTAIGGLYVRVGHPLDARKPASLSDIRRHRLASVHLPLPVNRQLSKFFGSDETGLLSPAMECESVLVLREYALQSDGVVIAPQEVFALEVAAGRMRRLKVPELDKLGVRTPLRMQLGLVRLPDRTPSAVARLLAERVRRQAAQSLLAARGAKPAKPSKRSAAR